MSTTQSSRKQWVLAAIAAFAALLIAQHFYTNMKPTEQTASDAQNPQAAKPASAAIQLGTSPLNDVIDAMTEDEKISLVMGTGMHIPGVELPEAMQGPAIGKIEGRVPGSAGATFAIPRLGIPSIVMADGPAGLRISPTRDDQPDQTFYATAFPIATLMATSWDTQLAEQVGQAMGQETREYGADVLLAPALNIHRYPLGGRNFEYYSEDPLLSGKMAAAMVRGVQSQGVGTSIKHYVANNHEWNRYSIDVKADQRALREIYLKGFEIAVKEAQPWTVMSSYNKLNGTYTSERRDLLTDILRDQWGFKGLVVTDWYGGRDAVAQIAAGNDLLMPGTAKQQQALRQAVKTGALELSALDTAVKHILQIIQQSPVFKGYQYSDKPDLTRHADIARQAAAEGMVLLKNQNHALPLKPKANIALFGISAYQTLKGGSGSGDVHAAYTIDLQQGLQAAGFAYHQVLGDSYRDYIKQQTALLPPTELFHPPATINERPVATKEIASVAAESDIAVISIGRHSGEFEDRKAENDFSLSDTEQALLKQVSTVFHQQGKKVVVVLNIGGVIETASWRDQVNAILLAWQPGQEAGHAITDILRGQVNPSGKLATTFALGLDDYPAAKNFPGIEIETEEKNELSEVVDVVDAEVDYLDSIWVGYRAFKTQKINTAYPFGFGLSYTQFDYQNLSLSSLTFNEGLTATVTITNQGKVAGREVVQLYIAAPQGKLSKPAAELRAFAKTPVLQPNESHTLTFELTASDLSSFDPDRNAWVADAGKYQLLIGASSTDIRQSKVFEKKTTTHLAL